MLQSEQIKNLVSHLISWIQLPERLNILRWSAWFFAIISGLMALIGWQYLIYYSFPKIPLAFFYTIAAFISHFFLLGFIPWLLLVLPLVILVPSRKYIFPLGVFLAAFMLSLVLLDGLVYARNQFHINALTMTILGWKTWGFGILYFFIFLVFSSLLVKWTFPRLTKPIKWRAGWIISSVVIVLLLMTHILHIWADATYFIPITKFTNNLPLFYPATAKKFMLKHGFVDLQQNRERQLMNRVKTSSHDQLLYPLKPLNCNLPDTLLNVLLITVDAFRGDMIKPTLTPNIVAFARQGQNFKNHYSGGNSSRIGMFSLFYGLPSTYWKCIEGRQRSALLIDLLQQYQYNLGIFTSAPLYRPTYLDRSAFSNIPNLRMVTHSPHNYPYENDAVITTEWRQWLDKNANGEPFFGFLFYDCPAAPDYDPQFKNKFPSPPNSSNLEKKLHKYKTALYYTDSLIGVVIRDLRERQLLTNTAVIITADHGDEFDDCGLGYIGHGSNYSKYQMHVPLIIHWPGRSSDIIQRRTSHNDIPATLITELFGCTNNPSDYCSGNHLFTNSQWDWLIAGSYYNYAIIDTQQLVINYPGGYFEVRNYQYEIINKPKLNRQILSQALNETNRFFKK